MKELLIQAQQQVEDLTSDLKINDISADVSGQLSDIVDTTSKLSQEATKDIQKGGGNNKYQILSIPKLIEK